MAKKPTAKPKAPLKPALDDGVIPGVVDSAGNAIRQESSIHGG